MRVGLLVDGARFAVESSTETEDYASNVAMRVIQLTTSFHAMQVVQMMTGTCNYYADNAIQARGVEFLAHQGHP